MSDKTTRLRGQAWIESLFAYRAPTPAMVPVFRECRRRFFDLAAWLQDTAGPAAMEAIDALHRAMQEANWAIAQSCPIAERLRPEETAT